jgi:hypothetical protein
MFPTNICNNTALFSDICEIITASIELTVITIAATLLPAPVVNILGACFGKDRVLKLMQSLFFQRILFVIDYTLLPFCVVTLFDYILT